MSWAGERLDRGGTSTHLNTKKRTCMQDNCSFVGTYKELRKHVKTEHPWARPREVDPSLAEKWKKLENDRELNDVMSTISSTMPGSIIMGDYVKGIFVACRETLMWMTTWTMCFLG